MRAWCAPPNALLRGKETACCRPVAHPGCPSAWQGQVPSPCKSGSTKGQVPTACWAPSSAASACLSPRFPGRVGWEEQGRPRGPHPQGAEPGGGWRPRVGPQEAVSVRGGGGGRGGAVPGACTLLFGFPAFWFAGRAFALPAPAVPFNYSKLCIRLNRF